MGNGCIPPGFNKDAGCLLSELEFGADLQAAG
jgi:hypothetical protein